MLVLFSLVLCATVTGVFTAATTGSSVQVPTLTTSFALTDYSRPGFVKFEWTPFELPKSHKLTVTLNCVHEQRDPVCAVENRQMHRALLSIGGDMRSTDGSIEWDVRDRKDANWYQESLKSKGVEVVFAIIQSDNTGHHLLSKSQIPILFTQRHIVL